jgi:hypothetical protein
MNAARNVLELEQRGVTALDHDRCRADLGQALHLEGQGSIGERGREVLEGLSLDRGHHGLTVCHGVVTS